MLKQILFAFILTTTTFSAAACLAAAKAVYVLAQALTEKQKIERLIDYVRHLKGAKFIRNGSEHNPQEAADHLQAKYLKHAARIQTAEVFINELASKSSASGEVYKIKLADGNVVPAGQVLKQELDRIN